MTALYPLDLLETFYLKLNDIYSTLKIPSAYLLQHYNGASATQPHFSDERELQELVQEIDKFIKENIFPTNFESDALTALRIKAFIECVEKYLEFILSPEVQHLSLSHRRTVFEKTLIDCTERLALINAQRVNIEKTMLAYEVKFKMTQPEMLLHATKKEKI